MTLSPSILQKLIIHQVGNKNQQQPLLISTEDILLTEESKILLQQGFLDRFKDNHAYQHFFHDTSLQYNEVYQFCQQVFESEENFVQASAGMAQHLYSQSLHPKIKGGDLYVLYFDGLPVESRVHKAIGIFKAETKSHFIDAAREAATISMQLREGVAFNKIDKGCLVVDNSSKNGYDVLVFDNQNRGEEAQYWNEKFLGIVPQKNEYHQTQHLLALTRQFITGPLEADMKVPKNEQADLLNRSITYFKSNESFDIDEFQSTIFKNDGAIEAFRQFGSRYTNAHDFDLAAQFEISQEAVKKQSRTFKSVVKLDKNFHIYIHGRTDLIEKGVDLDGRKYYKIFYKDEQ